MKTFDFLVKNIHYVILESVMDKISMPVDNYDYFMSNCLEILEVDKDTKTFKYVSNVKDYLLNDWMGSEHSFILEDKVKDMVSVYIWIEKVYRKMENCPNKNIIELYVRALEDFLNELEGRLDEYYYVSLAFNNSFTRWRLRKNIDKDIDNGLHDILQYVSARRLFRVNPNLNILSEEDNPI